MRVAHFLHHLNPYGTERVVQNLLRYRGNGFEEQFVVSAQDGEFADELRATDCEVFVETDAARLARHLAKADLVNAHCLYEHTLNEMTSVLRVARRPYLVTVHWPTTFQPGAAPVFVCTSRTAYRAQAPESHCELVENGIDLAPYMQVPERTRTDRFVITRVCRPLKNGEYFWYAMSQVLSRHPEVDLRIVGSLVKSGGRVQAVGVQGDVIPYLADTDLFVYTPKPGEGTKDLVVMEAMAMGLPSVLSDVEVTRASAVQGKTALLVPYDDTEALIGAVETLISDAELRRKLGRAARETALRRFDMRDRVRRYEEIYVRLLTGEYRPPVPTHTRSGWLRKLLSRPLPRPAARPS